MKYERLNAVVGTALVDSAFRRRLLAHSKEALRPFGLNAEEMEVVLSINASTLQEFASELYQWTVRETATRIVAGSGRGSRSERIPTMVPALA